MYGSPGWPGGAECEGAVRQMDIRSYIICATPRSGSTLLCDLLAGSGVAGRPASFYRRESIGSWAQRLGVPISEGTDNELFERRYLEAIRREGTAGTDLFGLRLMWPSLAELNGKLDQLFPGLSDDRARLEAAFGSTLYLHLTRADKVAQAVSRLRAEQSGLWHLDADGGERERSGPPAAPAYDAVAIEGFVSEAVDHDAAWRRWFAAQGIAPMPLSYEELSAAPQTVLADVLVALGQDRAAASRAKVRSSRMADAESADWAARYRASGRPSGD